MEAYNLRALVSGQKINDYQKILAKEELEKLIQFSNESDKMTDEEIEIEGHYFHHQPLDPAVNRKTCFILGAKMHRDGKTYKPE